MKTVQYTIYFGINEGYGHNNDSRHELEQVRQILQELCEHVFSLTTVYLSGVLERTNTIYSPNWGCPTGGEVTYKYEITLNPEFVNPFSRDIEKAFEILVMNIKNRFRQTTIQAIRKDIDDFFYVTDQQ